MKNQFFGDINDYRKYGLLRVLCGTNEINLAICWLLTSPDNDSSHGKKINYLSDPEKYRKFDRDLYDGLRKLDILRGKDRHVGLAKRFFPFSYFFYEEFISDNSDLRFKYFNEFYKFAKGVDLIFFDPDIGMEVNSVIYGKKDSSKYLYWVELSQAIYKGHSVIFYQHFPRVKRDKFINDRVAEVRKRIGIQKIWSFRTGNVVFFLLGQKRHFDIFSKQSEIVARNWQGQIEPVLHDTITKKPTSPPTGITHGPALPTEPSVSADQLDGWRRRIVQMVLQLEPESPPVKGPVARIRRLSQQERIPRNISALMVAVVEARNLAVWEGKVPVGPEGEAVRNAWKAVLQWAQNQGLDVDKFSG